MSWFNDKEKRGYIGSWAYIILVFIIITFLGFNEVPQNNKDLITTIIGMLVASLGLVVYVLIGKDENEVVELRKQNKQLLEQNEQLTERVKDLEGMFRSLQSQVIEKLSLIANNKK